MVLAKLISERFWITVPLIGCGRLQNGAGLIDATLLADAGDASIDDVILDRLGFDGLAAPREGEFQPLNGKPCDSIHQYCADVMGASCDLASGWCCAGTLKMGRCMCGQELGCQPPAICCPLAGQQDYSCVPNISACPAYAKD